MHAAAVEPGGSESKVVAAAGWGGAPGAGRRRLLVPGLPLPSPFFFFLPSLHHVLVGLVVCSCCHAAGALHCVPLACPFPLTPRCPCACHCSSPMCVQARCPCISCAPVVAGGEGQGGARLPQLHAQGGGPGALMPPPPLLRARSSCRPCGDPSAPWAARCRPGGCTATRIPPVIAARSRARYQGPAGGVPWP